MTGAESWSLWGSSASATVALSPAVFAQDPAEGRAPGDGLNQTFTWGKQGGSRTPYLEAPLVSSRSEVELDGLGSRFQVNSSLAEDVLGGP